MYDSYQNKDLNILYKITRFFWPLGAFNNKRSFQYYNILFVLNELIKERIYPLAYTISDDESISQMKLFL